MFCWTANRISENANCLKSWQNLQAENARLLSNSLNMLTNLLKLQKTLLKMLTSILKTQFSKIFQHFQRAWNAGIWMFFEFRMLKNVSEKAVEFFVEKRHLVVFPKFLKLKIFFKFFKFSKKTSSYLLDLQNPSFHLPESSFPFFTVTTKEIDLIKDCDCRESERSAEKKHTET